LGNASTSSRYLGARALESPRRWLGVDARALGIKAPGFNIQASGKFQASSRKPLECILTPPPGVEGADREPSSARSACDCNKDVRFTFRARRGLL
jgi:hypothetical protein